MLRNLRSIAFVLACGLSAMDQASADPASCTEDTLCRILTTKVLKVGTKDDYKPWSYRDPSGKFAGIEVDLAEELGKVLGAKVEFVKVNSANRFEFLAQGQIDLMIASASDTADRRKIVGMIHPNYYASGYNVILPKVATVKTWDQLSGQTVCALQGAWYNKPASEKFGIKTLAFSGEAEVDSALKQGRCIGILEDDNLANAQLADASQWSDYAMPLPTQDDTPWSMAVRLDDLHKPWGLFVSGAIYDWHRSGELLKVEHANGVAASAYLVKMHAEMKDFMPDTN
jgi:polar amino acid transport system substrate-binding protein